MCTLNYWPDDGLPVDQIARIAASQCEGDPRGNVSVAEMCEATQYGITHGWVDVRPENGSGRPFAFPTPLARDLFVSEVPKWVSMPG